MSADGHPDHASRGAELKSIAGLMVAPAFLALAAWFVLGSPRPHVPGAPTPHIDPAAIDPSPRRSPLSDPPAIVIGGHEQRCSDCHMLFRSQWDGLRPLAQHTHVRLRHGMNDECDNCHARADRERLVLHDGSEVPFSEVAILCAQCHGPIYNDWTRGVHGKTLGYWDPAQGPRRRLTCTACHDPHDPRYEPLEPLPGPHTLRMGRPHDTHAEPVVTSRNPLRLWSLDPPPHEREPSPGGQGTPEDDPGETGGER